MSKESRKEPTSESTDHQEKNASTAQVAQHTLVPVAQTSSSHHLQSIPPHRPEHVPTPESVEEPKATSKRDLPPETAVHEPDETEVQPRQVIAVSASKGPAAFFNLARKFLVTDEMCDLSALEGAIVSAVDAAHLLERSKLATITRIQTSYVTVEPKRRKQAPVTPGAAAEAHQVYSPVSGQTMQDTGSSGSPQESQARRTSTGRELRRARIVITVKRTQSYKKWLEDNPLQAIIAGDVEDDQGVEPALAVEP